MTRRVETLDYLRGVMAFSIMIYHYSHWGIFDIPEFLVPPLDLLGKYAVSIFYILSGAALYLVYSERSKNSGWIIEYATKRVLRIGPLLWVATLATIFLRRTYPDLSVFLLNISLLFGFFAPDQYIATGAWSIGNEVVFYALFPIVALFSRSNIGRLLTILSGAIPAIYFTIFTLSPDLSLSKQWASYINPLNQFYLFLFGLAIGSCIKNCKDFPAWSAWSLTVISSAFIWALSYKYQGIDLVTGWQRFAISGLCVILCLSIGLLRAGRKTFIGKAFGILGASSYSLYLCHPIIAEQSKDMGMHTALGEYFPVLLISSVLIISYLSYLVIERSGIKLAQFVTRDSRRMGYPVSKMP